jgi:cell division protein FtsZ
MNSQKINTAELDLRPRISVIGVGGAGGNAVNNMIRAKLEGVEFVVANTDAQSLEQSLVMPERRIQLGLHITQGLGAGSKPDVGRASAEESLEEVVQHLHGSNMVFITAGMGGGTGTGAAPVIARTIRESGILTVGVVTKPFNFEGSHRSRVAEKGIEELQQYVDTLIIIPNQNLFRIATEHTTFAQAFEMADNVLSSGVRNVTDLMMRPGLINLDFADIRAVMAEMGKAMMGTGEAEGDRRAIEAADMSIDNPLLDDVSMKGAKGVLINITGGYDMTLYEVDEAANRVRENADPDANIIFGSTFDEKLNGKIRVSVVATGIGALHTQTSWRNAQPEHGTITPTERQNGLSSNPVQHLGLKDLPSFEQDHTSSNSPSSSFSTSENFPPETSALQQQTSPKGEPYSQANLSQESGNNPSYTQQPLAPQSPKASPSERKRAPSLFERFTGAGRQRSQTPPVAEQPVKTQASEDDKEHDVLDIPAFLRRGNQ